MYLVILYRIACTFNCMRRLKAFKLLTFGRLQNIPFKIMQKMLREWKVSLIRTQQCRDTSQQLSPTKERVGTIEEWKIGN